LRPWLLTTTGNIGTGFGLMRTKARIRLLANQCLVHQIILNGGFKDLCR
jgi:hypothetical protein